MSRDRLKGSVGRWTGRGLVLLALPVLAMATWGVLDPRGWFREFGWTQAWVARLGPFNEHLVLDFNLSQLALALMLLAGAWTLAKGWVRLALVAWLVFAAPHFLFHGFHQAPFDGVNGILMMAALGLQILLPLGLLGWTFRSPGEEPAPRRRAKPVGESSPFRRINPASGFWTGLLSWMTKRRFGEPFQGIRIAGHHGGVLFGSSMYEAAVDGFDALEKRLQELLSLRAAQMIGCPF